MLLLEIHINVALKYKKLPSKRQFQKSKASPSFSSIRQVEATTEKKSK